MNQTPAEKNHIRLDVQEAIHKLSVAACDAINETWRVKDLSVYFYEDDHDGLQKVEVTIEFEHGSLKGGALSAAHQKIRALALAMLRELTDLRPSLTFERLKVAGFDDDTKLEAVLDL